MVAHRLTARDGYALAAIAGLSFVLLIGLYLGGIADRLAGSAPAPAFEAQTDFWLRAAPADGAERVAFVRTFARVDVLATAAGEPLDPGLPAPDRWYRVRVRPGGEVGWAYSGWLSGPVP